jgi:hypothetical protein
MELAEVTRQTDADEQRAQAEREDVAGSPRIERPDAREESRYPTTALKNLQRTLTVAEESPWPGGFAKGL